MGRDAGTAETMGSCTALVGVGRVSIEGCVAKTVEHMKKGLEQA